jgi:hypothetical protein
MMDSKTTLHSRHQQGRFLGVKGILLIYLPKEWYHLNF